MRFSASATITAGQTVSAAVALPMNETALIWLEIPTLTATDIYVQGSSDGVTYRRVMTADQLGDWKITASTGNRFIFIDDAAPVEYLKVEIGTTQAGDVIFKVLAK